MPSMVFNVPLHASPMPIHRATSPASAAPADPPAQVTPSTASADARAQSERRPHITLVSVPPTPPSQPALPPTHQQGALDASRPANQHHHHHHHHVVYHHAPTLHRPPFAIFPRPNPGEQPPAPETRGGSPAPAATKAAPFVPISLESWTAQREKTLGWRCDGTDCLIAPSTDPDPDGDVEMSDEEVVGPGGKDMVSIHSPIQPPVRAPEHDPGQEKGREFVVLACEHRWHRACRETAERSAGRGVEKGEGDGRVWVRCQRCRRDGWVEETDGTPSEREQAEVARLVSA